MAAESPLIIFLSQRNPIHVNDSEQLTSFASLLCVFDPHEDPERLGGIVSLLCLRRLNFREVKPAPDLQVREPATSFALLTTEESSSHEHMDLARGWSSSQGVALWIF